MAAAGAVLAAHQRDGAVQEAELDLPYASICVVVNHAAGRGDSGEAISMQALLATLEGGMAKVRTLLDHLAPIAAPPGDPK